MPDAVLILCLALPPGAAEPPACDLAWLPPPAVCRRQLALARGRSEWLVAHRRLGLDRDAVNRDLARLGRTYWPWQLLAWAHQDAARGGGRAGDPYTVTARHMLAALRAWLGHAAYYQGRLPPPVDLDSCRRAE